MISKTTELYQTVANSADISSTTTKQANEDNIWDFLPKTIVQEMIRDPEEI